MAWKKTGRFEVSVLACDGPHCGRVIADGGGVSYPNYEIHIERRACQHEGDEPDEGDEPEIKHFCSARCMLRFVEDMPMED